MSQTSTILVTGGSGFAGTYLVEFLRTRPHLTIWTCDRTGPNPRLGAAGASHHVKLDLLDPVAARRVMADIRPDYVYHLAGQAFVGQSWSDPWGTLEINVRAQLNLLEAALAERINPRFLSVGSMEEYGRVAERDLPIREAQALRPDSPYGVSKVAQDMLGLQYHLSRGLPVIRVRPFNHIGPRQSRRFVAPAFASQIAAIEAGKQAPVIQVGNLSARRDFTDVRDVVRAYVLALEHGEPGEVYNIGSGGSHSIQSLLERLLSYSTQAITIETDSERLRPADVPDVVCDARHLRDATGWQPRITFDQSLRDLLAYERTQVDAAAAAPGA
ncbi:MAG: GDP-mannose 4,6-dehydratase [Anaerolineales bacterium]|nr:GDP-mannose 4,6-dehydratase [Anaerolineales bacterium]